MCVHICECVYMSVYICVLVYIYICVCPYIYVDYTYAHSSTQT